MPSHEIRLVKARTLLSSLLFQKCLPLPPYACSLFLSSYLWQFLLSGFRHDWLLELMSPQPFIVEERLRRRKQKGGFTQSTFSSLICQSASYTPFRPVSGSTHSTVCQGSVHQDSLFWEGEVARFKFGLFLRVFTFLSLPLTLPQEVSG